METLYFESPARFRAWLKAHHAKATEVWVGFHKVATGKPSLTWSQSVDEALCYGWIDGLRQGQGPDAYRIRFTPRKAGSIWSKVNLAKIGALRAAGKMTPAGEAAFARRREDRTGVYSFERDAEAVLTAAEKKAFKALKGAWKWFEAQAPSYRKSALHWVASAKKDETRARRFEALAADSAAGKRLKQFTWEKKD
jgi:uncharacterized protein YdeI (YjbR/CyaY-like superfamily)